MTTDAAAVFAQIIPVLLIATYIGNTHVRRAPAFIRSMLFYTVLLVAVTEFILLLDIARGTPPAAFQSTLAVIVTGWLLLFVVFLAAVHLLGDNESRDSRQGRKSTE